MRELLAKPLLVVTGKGGVGKSTVAAALGLAAAAEGRRTIVAEVSARDDVHRALRENGAPRTFVERELAHGLHHISIDPESALEEYLRDQLPRGVADLLATSRTFALLAAATPGLRELLTIGKVWELAQPDRRTPGAHPYDLVVLDAPATGHGVAILSAPSTFADAARVGPIARQGGLIHAMLADPERTAIVGVATPEEMPVAETLGLHAALGDGLGQHLAAVVVNGMLPQRFSAGDVTALEGSALAQADGTTQTALRAALGAAARAKAQQGQLARLRRGLPDVPLRTLPLLAGAELGTEELGRLAREVVRR